MYVNSVHTTFLFNTVCILNIICNMAAMLYCRVWVCTSISSTFWIHFKCDSVSSSFPLILHCPVNIFVMIDSHDLLLCSTYQRFCLFPKITSLPPCPCLHFIKFPPLRLLSVSEELTSSFSSYSTSKMFILEYLSNDEFSCFYYAISPLSRAGIVHHPSKWLSSLVIHSTHPGKYLLPFPRDR